MYFQIMKNGMCDICEKELVSDRSEFWSKGLHNIKRISSELDDGLSDRISSQVSMLLVEGRIVSHQLSLPNARDWAYQQIVILNIYVVPKLQYSTSKRTASIVARIFSTMEHRNTRNSEIHNYLKIVVIPIRQKLST